jgi:hypothetical protein|tara:strand:- start:40 stop:225 length:186 start_codon:yes stop_codon:yes gene_type:complete
MSQNKKLLSYLKKNGSIDPMQSLNELGIYRLAARIYDLRSKGNIIKTIKQENGYTKYIYTS